jgi:RNA polymerase sigma factor (TIGR02999 family)
MKSSPKQDRPHGSSRDATQKLLDWRIGRQEALDQLMPLVYDELHRLAERYLRRERPDHTLQPTALVHEAYLQLVDQANIRWENRAHFFGIAAHLMRQILVQHARSHQRLKRGGGERKLSLDDTVGLSNDRDVDVIALDDALTSLAAISPQQSQIVELRFFGGLTIEETAEVLGVSPMTVKNKWNLARAWLYSQIKTT